MNTKEIIENYPQLEKEIKDVESAVIKHRRVDSRQEELEGKGYHVDTFPMGSGGVGQVVPMKDSYRIQIGYGEGKWNYAKAIEIRK